VAGLAVVLAGCDPATATPSASATVARATVQAGGSVPTPPRQGRGTLPGPYAVVATNSVGQVASYQVLLITTDARVAAQVTAAGAPGNGGLLIGNLSLPRVSASSTRAYYLENGNEIRWLAPDGSTGTVRSLPLDGRSQLSFAVSPDDRRIAVTVFTTGTSMGTGPGLTTRTYVENLRDSSAHVELGTTTGYADPQWVAGWHGAGVVESVSSAACWTYVGPATSCGLSLRLVSAATGAPIANLCAPAPGSSVATMSGLPTGAGTVCADIHQESTSSSRLPAIQSIGTIAAVDWNGHQRVFLASADPARGLAVGGCFLAPDGAQMACNSNASQAVTFLSPTGALRDLGTGYRILGWLDSSHLLVAVDVQTLGVVSVERGSTRLLTKGETDYMELAGTLPASG
jgi:hypothetical protein